MITFSENQDADLIAYEDGIPLAQAHDPKAQGLKWVYSLGNIPASHVIVMGLGSGFHIAALAELDVKLKITVIETRESLVRVFRSQFPDLSARVDVLVIEKPTDIFKTDFFQEILSERPFVLSFQECWGRQGDLFAELFAHATGRSLESVKYHFQEFGIDIKSSFAVPVGLVSLKEMMNSIEASSLRENKKQIFRVLGELVK